MLQTDWRTHAQEHPGHAKYKEGVGLWIGSAPISSVGSFCRDGPGQRNACRTLAEAHRPSLVLSGLVRTMMVAITASLGEK